MGKHDMLSSGVNDELLTLGVISVDCEDDDSVDDDFGDDDSIDDDQKNDDQKDDDSTDDDVDDQQKEKKPIDRKQKFHSTVTSQNRTIATLQREMNLLKNTKNLSDEDMAKIKEKYSEEDLQVIEKIIEKKAGDLMDQRKTTSLAQRELNIFVKEHPEITDPELRHVQSLQKDYGYSLKKAYSIIFGKGQETDNKPAPRHSISDSFGGGSNPKSASTKESQENDKAFKDMEAFL